MYGDLIVGLTLGVRLAVFSESSGVVIQFIDLIKAIVLGIVEGITEFLPISSTGHLLIAARLLDFQRDANGTFEIFIQLGAVIAVVIFYRATLIDQIRRVRSDRSVQHFWLAIVLATIPAAVIGFVLRSWIKSTLFVPPVIALSFIIGGIVLLLVERRPKIDDVVNESSAALEAVTFRQALIIGCAQVIALIPGVSRSAASIIGGISVGLSRRTATEFSFFLAIPTLGGATIVDLFLSLDGIQSDEWVYLFVGLFVSFLVALAAIAWLLRYISRHSFAVFGVYRIVMGLIILVLVAAKFL